MVLFSLLKVERRKHEILVPNERRTSLPGILTQQRSKDMLQNSIDELSKTVIMHAKDLK